VEGKQEVTTEEGNVSAPPSFEIKNKVQVKKGKAVNGSCAAVFKPLF
jgi:hypothetical protein